MTRWQTRTTKDPTVLAELSGWWDVQPAAREIPFLNTVLLRCWIDALIPHDQHPDFQILYKDGALAAAAPMLKSRGRMFSMANHVNPFDLISAEDDEIAEYVPRWLNTWNVAHFYKVREASVLVKQAPAQPRWMVTKARTSPYVDLAQGIDVARTRTSKEHRRAIQRRTRRLKEIGELTFTDHPQEGDLASVLDRGLALEASGWKGQKGGAVLSRPDFERWYRALAEAAAEKGWLRLSTLNLDERMVTFAYDIVYGGRRYGMLSAYDESPEMSRLSVGTILVDRMLEQSSADGLASYEFGHGSIGWKRNWTDTEHTVFDISTYGSGLVGRTMFRARSLRSSTPRPDSGS